MYSGAFDGELKEWNLSTRNANWSVKAHDGCVRGVCSTADGSTILTCGDDCSVKYWNYDPLEITSPTSDKTPKHQIIAKTNLTGIDCQWRPTEQNCFAVSAQDGNLYVYQQNDRTDPMRTYNWGADTVTSVKFNPSEHDLISATGIDRSIMLYDLRVAKPIRKITLAMNSNCISWNPYNPIQFAVANEDYHTYIFDTRNLDHAKKILKGHISAVMSCSFSPTGRQLVTGSYDKTLRIYNTHGNEEANSTDVYHTKRMQKVFSVNWTPDNKYIISASDEMNIRVWKSKADDQLGYLSATQKSNKNYRTALKKKFANYPEIRKISKKRHLSKHIYVQTKQHKEIRDRLRRKEQNRRIHNKNLEHDLPARQKIVVKEME